MGQERKHFRVTDRLECSAHFNLVNKEKTISGVIFDIGGGGLMMVAKEKIAAGVAVQLKIKPPLGPMEVKAKVKLEEVDFIQALSYLRASGCRGGLLLNFGGQRLEIKRLAN